MLRCMIGRQTEINQLNDFIKRGKSGNPGIIFVSGPAGIGKTTLIQEVLADQKEIMIFENRQLENNSYPFGPVASMLRFFLTSFNISYI